MSGNGSDRDLEGLFESVRREDRQGAPPFVRTWNEARRRATAPSRRHGGLRLVLAAALTTAAIAAGVLLVRGHRGGGLSFSAAELAMARELSDWTAPSDGFASVSGVQVSVAVPSLEIESVQLPTISAPEPEPVRTGSPSRANP